MRSWLSLCIVKTEYETIPRRILCTIVLLSVSILEEPQACTQVMLQLDLVSFWFNGDTLIDEKLYYLILSQVNLTPCLGLIQFHQGFHR